MYAIRLLLTGPRSQASGASSWTPWHSESGDTSQTSSGEVVYRSWRSPLLDGTIPLGRLTPWRPLLADKPSAQRDHTHFLAFPPLAAVWLGPQWGNSQRCVVVVIGRPRSKVLKVRGFMCWGCVTTVTIIPVLRFALVRRHRPAPQIRLRYRRACAVCV